MEITKSDVIKGGIGLVTGGPVGAVLSPAVGRAVMGKTWAWALIGVVGGPMSWFVSSIPFALLTAPVQEAGQKVEAVASSEGAQEPEEESVKPERQERQQARRGKVSMENYNLLQTGMTYEQVVEILGEEGTEMSRVEALGSPTVMYMWKAGGFSAGNMNATFQDNELFSKAQYGLP